ncbi:uncharacterized protein LOC129762227 [Toxorhynchites rutilus septentrionalis]|uniref:uncharacterized protein LOC129762227 n=1 Tax=Toxorhynchites rutilus septentrionalis TaxID=329112 RepID=UPI00247A1BE9|nr:uncharacterized protein LOC129762227 [Toxorhynchites rutilus septentrionalis]
MDTAQVGEESVAVYDQTELKICRLCCSDDQQELILIFSDSCSYEANKLLLKKIFECTTVQITSEGDDQNALICQLCIAKIDDFYAYREQCKANDDRIRQRIHNLPQICIKQEKDLHFDISISEPISTCEGGFQQEESSQPRISSHSTTAANEFVPELENDATSKDADDSLLQPMSSVTHTEEEITIKRETIEDDDVYYNSDGEVADVSLPPNQPSSSSTAGQKTKYRIIMAANNRERLVYQGYLYCRHSTRRDGSIHWRCRLGGCQAAVNLLLDETIAPANGNKHCHPRNVPEDTENGTEETEDDDSNVLDNDDASYEPFDEDDTTQDDVGTDLEPVAVSPDSLVIVPNKKKGETLVHLGFKYCKRYNKMDGSTFWKCRSNNNKCSAGVYVHPDSRVKYHGTHNHEKVVNEGEVQEQDADNTAEEDVHQPYTIVEDVEEDDGAGGGEFTDDMVVLLNNSVEVMMPEDQKQIKKEFEITTNVKGRECLIYEGHQYSKDRERSDGAVLWRCRRNYDKCRSVAVVYKNNRVEKFGEHHHETDKRYLERQEQGHGSRYYRITKNQRGNDALVFEGNRFSKEWSRVDGSIIWRCSYKSGICRVKVVLNSDGMVHRMGGEHEHDHEQTEAEVTEEFFDEDVEIVDESLLVTPTRNQLKTAAKSPIHTPNFTPEPQPGNYRIVKNRKGFEALVYDGYRYCKVRVKQDGSVKWLCKMNKKTCRAAVDLYPDGTIIKATDFEHNHERPTDMEAPDEDDEPEIPGQEVTYPIDPDVFGNSQWYYVKNSKNGMSMMHAGYRYTKKCDRVDGTSLWRCSASQRGCKAGVILFPNDTLAMVENAEHSHRPYDVNKTADGEKDASDMQKSDVIEIDEADQSANESDINMHSLLQTVLGGDEVPWMGGESDKEQLSESVWFNSATDRPYPRPTGPPDFKIIKNRRNTDSLVHRGYRYCKIRDRVDGSILWACQMNKKTCRASVNLAVDGSVEVINGKHNHQKTDFDDGEGPEQIVVQPKEPIPDVELATDSSNKIKQHTGKPVKHPDYYYSLNKSNRECLIHKGYRFCKRSDRPDGSTTWRCSMGGNTCMVVVTIHADGTPEENSVKHNHHPLADLPPEIEREVKPKVEPMSETKKAPYNRKGDILEWNGFNYRKIKELPDGCIIWICQIDSCRVAVKMLPNGQLKMLSESEHNHTATGQLPSAPSTVAPAKSTTSAGSTTTENKTRCYRLFKNQRGQMTLLYKGYRYSIRNRNQDGSSSWKCRANSSCRVIIYLMADDRIVHGINNAEHNHEPNWESTKKLEAVMPTRVNPLYDYLNIVPGATPNSDQQTDKPTNSSEVAKSENVNFGKNVIEHKGYYYRLVVRKKNGREYWRCVHFRNRTCRAALFCRDNGTIITSSNGKEHSHGKGAESKPTFPAHAHAGSKQTSNLSRMLQGRSSAQPSPPDEVQLTSRDDERYIDHGDYVIAKNRKDQNTLIFKDRRYYLSYSRSDGSAVWRCAHRKRYKCYAYVRLRPDGRLLSTGEQEHSHSLNTEENPPPSGAKETRNYKIVKNRVGNDILIHDSHRFRLNYQRNDGTTHWRCIWARSNHCSAGVYLFVNGVLKNAANESAITHNHPPPSQMRKVVVKPPAAQLLQDQSETQDGTDKPQNRTNIEDDGTTDFKFVEDGNSKTLICRGYRYWYAWVRKNGSIYYRCVENKKLQCPSGVVLLSNGKLAQASPDCHNHDPSRDEAEEEFLGFPAELQLADASQQEETLEQFPPLDVAPGGDTDFKIVKTSRGESLIYKGYRYWAKNRLANGIVSLCCTRKKMKKCPAMLRLLTNGRIMDPVGAGHTHPPNIEGGGNPADSRVQPVAAKPTPQKPVLADEPVKIKVAPQTAKLPALSFNEESDDDAEQGDESLIGSRRYAFMKSSAQRNFIVYKGFVYDFEHKQHDGCVFYRCKSSDACPASLMLLSNGRVMNMDDSLHIHEKPDLSSLRQVGRGSKEFKIVQNKNGSNILVHRGHRYTTPRAKTDGAGIWYCHTYVPEINRRCYVPIELLPNGRVAPVGDKQHNHTAPFKTKQDATTESKDNVVSTVKPELNHAVDDTAENKMLLLGGHRYTYAHTREDRAILWKCARKSCNASLYRLSDGHIVKGPDHNHEKLEAFDATKSFKRKYSDVETKVKSSSPVVREGDSKSQWTPRPGQICGNPYIGQSIINDGYRYIYYLTRKDGSEHWRCCRRIPLKCRGGLYKQPDGTLSCSNDEGHTHPPDHTHLEDMIPMTYTRAEHAHSNSNDAVDVGEPPEPSPDLQASHRDDEGSYDYKLIDVKGKKRGQYLVHKGAMFVGGHTRRGRARYYRCRTPDCRVAMLLRKNGLLVRYNEYTHDCKNVVDPDNVEDDDDDDDDNDNDGGIHNDDDNEYEEQHPEPANKKQCLVNQDEDETSSTEPVAAVGNPDDEQITNGSEPTVDEVVEVKQEPIDTF